MTYLLDTTAFSDPMREHPGMDARLAALPSDDRMVICTLVRGGIRYGIERVPQGMRRQELAAKATRLFAALSCEAVPEAAADHYASVKLVRERHGLTLDENDLSIAATSLALGSVLVSRDTDFDGIDGLAVENWVG